MLQGVGDQFQGLINARGRSSAHVAEGVALCTLAVLASAAIAGAAAPTKANPKRERENARLHKPDFQPPKKTFGAVWAPLFAVLTLSGIRIWNAPESRARGRALGLWGGLQVLNALTMLWGPRRQTATLVTHLASLGGAFAYLNEARKVDATYAAIVSPYLGWMSFAGILSEEVWRKNKDRPTIH
jgi:tryptophan-rich sensory protein